MGGSNCKKLWACLLSMTLVLDAEEEYKIKKEVFLTSHISVSGMLTKACPASEG